MTKKIKKAMTLYSGSVSLKSNKSTKQIKEFPRIVKAVWLFWQEHDNLQVILSVHYHSDGLRKSKIFKLLNFLWKNGSIRHRLLLHISIWFCLKENHSDRSDQLKIVFFLPSKSFWYCTKIWYSTLFIFSKTFQKMINFSHRIC